MCAFPNMCSVALEPTGKTKGFSYYSSAGAATPVRRLAIHLGAPGDHADAAGQLWLGYPRPRGPLIMPLNLEVSFCPGGGYVTGNSTYSATAGTADAWLFAAAAKGLTRLVVRLLEPDDGASLYRVRLAMADPDNQTPGRRVFDVKLQGRRVRSRCDIAGETGGANRALMAEFSGVEVTDKLVVELVPAMAGRLAPEQMPILQGIEVVRERVVRLGCSVPRFEVNTAHPRQTARLQLTNLRDAAFRGRLEIAAAEGFALSPRQAAVELPSGGRQAIELELVASPSARPGTWPITVRLARADGSLELEQAGTVEHLGRHARQVIPASEDTYAMQRYPDLNKGTATVLMVDGGDQVMGDVDHSVAYLKFPLPATDRVISARLRLTNAGNPSFDAGRVCLVNQPWRETELTYVNRPAPGQELARIGRVEAYQVVEIPLRVDLAGKRELSLAIDPTSLDGVDFVSREGGKPPELIVEYQQE
jgi:hypothetical protein